MTYDVMYVLTYCKSIIYQNFSYIFAVTTSVINTKNHSYGKRKMQGKNPSKKPQVTENEQMSDIVFILDKMELILEAVFANRTGRKIQHRSRRQAEPELLSED